MYRIDIENKDLIKLEKTMFQNENLRERYDIQEWIEKRPEIIEENLLIIGKEVVLPSDIRLDLLAIDKDSNLVVLELKRDTSGKNVDWQAIKYASYCSSFSNADIFKQFAEYSEVSEEEAEAMIEKFVNADDLEGLNENQRIILVSKEFHSDVVSSVLWLRDYGIDISCVKLTLYLNEDKKLFISPNKIIPLPEAEDYLIKKEQRQKEVRRFKGRSFSLEKSDYDNERLIKELKQSLDKESELVSRVIAFLEIILEEDREFKREELKQKLYERNIGDDIGKSGTYLSNISQFLTKKSNPHFRQIITFDGGNSIGEVKNNYYVLEDYRDLLKKVLNDIIGDYNQFSEN